LIFHEAAAGPETASPGRLSAGGRERADVIERIAEPVRFYL
jgi:hypothetical protein